MTMTNEADDRPTTLATKVGRFASKIGNLHYPAGDRAALKRWAPEQPLPLAYYRLWLREAGDDLPAENQNEPWMTVVWGLALMGESAHRPGKPLGEVLALTGYHEARLERLLAAPDELRIELFMGVVRFLAAKGEGFDWTGAATFLLATEADAREAVRRRIARDYYRHLPKETSA